MTTIREHPVSVLVALLAGLALGAVANLGNWSDAALYAAAVALIVVLAPSVLLAEHVSKHRHKTPRS